MSEASPRLSACLIGRDEIEGIERCLRSLQGVADEWVVIDTGSSDGSAERAAALGARVERIAWPGSFARARNLSLERATGSWILVIDADEWIDATAGRKIRRCLRGGPPCAFTFIQRNYVDRADVTDLRRPRDPRGMPPGAVGWVNARQTRLFPNDPRIRYVGAVHEEVRPALERAGIEIRDLPVVVHHIGRMRGADRMRAKAELYARLGRDKLEARPDDPAAALELAVQSVELGRAEDAVPLLQTVLASPGAGPVLRWRARRLLARHWGRTGRFHEALALLSEPVARVEWAGNAEAESEWLELMASLELESGATDRALERLRAAPRLRALGWRLRATAALRTGAFDEAEEAYRRLREEGSSPELATVGLALTGVARGCSQAADALVAGAEDAVLAGLLRAMHRYVDPMRLRAWVDGLGTAGRSRVLRCAAQAGIAFEAIGVRCVSENVSLE